MGIFCMNSKDQSERGSVSYSDLQDPENSKSLWYKFTTEIETQIGPVIRADKNLRHRRAEVDLKLVQVESSGRDLHEVQKCKCIKFFQQTKIQSDLL